MSAAGPIARGAAAGEALRCGHIRPAKGLVVRSTPLVHADRSDVRAGPSARRGGAPCRASAPRAFLRGGEPSPLDVVGLGQAMVDYAGYVSDAFLQELVASLGVRPAGFAKGERICVNPDEVGLALNKLDGADFKVTTGGSLSNTLVAISRLGTAGQAEGMTDAVARVGMAGPVGNDRVGSFYRAKMQKAGVRFLSRAVDPMSTTGTCIVLTTPDAQRTMLSHAGTPPAEGQGAAGEALMPEEVARGIRGARILLVEGYLWECGPGARQMIKQAIKIAKAEGVLVCLTLSDATVVQGFRDELWRVCEQDADVVFANAAEARELTGLRKPSEAAGCLAELTRVASVVTDGSKGSFIAGMGRMHHVAPFWMPKGPLDTCGAGDAYAAGALHALLGGANIEQIGYAGARVASTVISQSGARLKREDAAELAQLIPQLATWQHPADFPSWAALKGRGPV